MIKISLGKEIFTMENTAEPSEDLMVPSKIVDLTKGSTISIENRNKILNEYNLASLKLETTSNINPFCKEETVSVTVDISKKGYLFSTGWISPLWFLAHRKTVCCIKKENILLAQFELVFRNYSIEEYVDNPTLIASNFGNSIYWSVQENVVYMDIMYTRNIKFDEYCIEESRRIQRILLPPLQPKQPEPQQQPKPKPKDEILPSRCACDIDYWDTLFNLPSEEQAYYGWERDPQ